VIDFGRASWRPAVTDFPRLLAQQFRDRPDLEAAFAEGYGPEYRDTSERQLARMYDAIGTACWAHQVGDNIFEAQGLE
jgi:hypothetical protein